MWHRGAPPEPKHQDDDKPKATPGLIDDQGPPSQLPLARWSGHDATDDAEGRRELRQSLNTLRGSCQGGVLSSKRVIDPLLDLWSLASSVDRTAARPIEPLLAATVERSVISSDELMACIDRVETVLAVLPPSELTSCVREGPARANALADTKGFEPELELWITDSQEPVQIRLAGQLSAPTAAHLGDVLRSLRALGHADVAFDFKGIESVDGESLGVLVRVVREATCDGGNVRVAGSSELVCRALELHGLGRAIERRSG
jgi:anti-anti-sigma factor